MAWTLVPAFYVVGHRAVTSDRQCSGVRIIPATSSWSNQPLDTGLFRTSPVTTSGHNEGSQGSQSGHRPPGGRRCVLVQINVRRRNRAFEAPELIDTFTALERQLASPAGDTGE